MKVVLSSSLLDPAEEYDHLVECGKLDECEITLPSIHLSVSQLGTYARCPRQYEFRYIKGVISPPQARMAEGTAVHRALEVGHRERQDTGSTAPLSVLLDAHNDAWKNARADITKWDDDYDSEDTVVKRGQTFLTKYHKHFLPRLKPVGIEKRFWVSLGASNIPVLGYIDLLTEYADADTGEVNGEIEVVDYKVIARTKSRAEVDGDLQLTLYSGAAHTQRVRFDMFVKTKDPSITTLRSLRTPKDWKWAEQVFTGVAEAIAKGAFPPCLPTNWTCTKDWCGYWHLCRGGL